MAIIEQPLQSDSGLETSGNVVAGNVLTDNYLFANGQSAVYTDANVSTYLAGGTDTANIITTGNVSGAYVLGNISQATGLGNVSTINLNGNTATYLTGNGTWAGAVTPAAIANGTSAVSIPAADGNVIIDVFGNTIATLGDSTIAIGKRAASVSQGANSIAIGIDAGQDTQRDDAIAIGTGAGFNIQGTAAIAIGLGAAAGDPAASPPLPRNAQGNNAVAIGTAAAANYQSDYSVAIGYRAGWERHGNNSIAIGALAGNSASADNSIVISASGVDLPTTNSGFYVSPVRNDTGNVTNVVYYNTTTKEVTYGASYGDGNVSTYLASGNNTAGYTTTGNISANEGTLSGNLSVGGNLTVAGNLNYQDVTDLVVGDPLIYIGANNTADIVDLGIVGSYTPGNTELHTGLVKDASDHVWKLFSNVSQEPTTTVDFTDAVYDTLLAGAVSTTGNITAAGAISATGNVSGNVVGGTTVLAVGDGVYSVGVVSASGNVTGGNITTAGLVTATGNVTGGNITTAGVVSATGNVTGNYFIGNGSQLTGLTTTTTWAAITDKNNGSGPTAIALGQNSGATSQGVQAIAFGLRAGQANQGPNGVAIGVNAGNSSQGATAIAIGQNAGITSQGIGAVAVGPDTGSTSQGISAVAVGSGAGGTSQGNAAVALGQNAGAVNQGANSVAIGTNAGYGNQTAGSIAINASGANLNPTTAGFYVNPVRNDTGNVTNVIYYNTTTKEVTYGPASGGSTYGDANVSSYLAGGTNTAGISTTGNVTANNLIATNTITISGNVGTGNISGANNISGINLIASNTIVAGATITQLPNSIATFGANVDSYAQINFQNKSSGTNAEADFVVTADNGSDSVNYINMGIVNSAYDNTTPTNSLGNIIYAADSYLYAQGNNAATTQSGGNLAIGTTTVGKNVKIFAGGGNTGNLVATFGNTGIVAPGNISGNYILGNGAFLTGIAGGGSSTSISNGTSNVSIPTSGGNILMSAGGIAAFNLSPVDNSIAIGTSARATSPGSRGIAIGQMAGQSLQGSYAVAIGYMAGNNNQSGESVAVGPSAGQAAQGLQSTAVGAYAGWLAQGASAVAIGCQAGNSSQSANAVAIGRYAGFVNQGTGAIAIGFNTGNSGQGANSIAIGTQAGVTSQAAGSIILNASGATQDASNAGFYVNPVRNDTGNTTNVVYFNTSTKELTYGPASGGSGNVTIDSFATSTVTSGSVNNYDCTSTQIFYVDASAATNNWGINLTNLSLASGKVTNVTFIIVSGSSYTPFTDFQIGGTAQTVVWNNAIAPAFQNGVTVALTYSILNNGGTYVILASGSQYY